MCFRRETNARSLGAVFSCSHSANMCNRSVLVIFCVPRDCDELGRLVGERQLFTILSDYFFSFLDVFAVFKRYSLCIGQMCENINDVPSNTEASDFDRVFGAAVDCGTQVLLTLHIKRG